MDAIRTVLCPIDFTPATRRQLHLAADLARLFGARLIVHHNIAGLSLGAGVGWMWAAAHPQVSDKSVRERILALCKDMDGARDVEISITRGPATVAVLAVGESVRADLVVLSTHGVSADEHTSVTADVLEEGRRSILALHDNEREDFGFDLASGHRQVTLVPTDFTPESRAAVDFALELARTLPLELHLLHLMAHAGKGERHDRSVAEMEQDLRALLPTEFADSAKVHVREDSPAHGIVQAARDLGAACIVMGEHTRAPLRRWFSRDTSRGVLHEAPCPVWYVPGAAVHAAR